MIGVKPVPAQNGPGIAHEALNLRERTGTLDVGQYELADVDADVGRTMSEKHLDLIEDMTTGSGVKYPATAQRCGVADVVRGRITGHMDLHLPNVWRLLTDATVGRLSRMDGIELLGSAKSPVQGP